MLTRHVKFHSLFTLNLIGTQGLKTRTKLLRIRQKTQQNCEIKEQPEDSLPINLHSLINWSVLPIPKRFLSSTRFDFRKSFPVFLFLFTLTLICPSGHHEHLDPKHGPGCPSLFIFFLVNKTFSLLATKALCFMVNIDFSSLATKALCILVNKNFPLFRLPKPWPWLTKQSLLSDTRSSDFRPTELFHPGYQNHFCQSSFFHCCQGLFFHVCQILFFLSNPSLFFLFYRSLFFLAAKAFSFLPAKAFSFLTTNLFCHDHQSFYVLAIKAFSFLAPPKTMDTRRLQLSWSHGHSFLVNSCLTALWALQLCGTPPLLAPGPLLDIDDFSKIFFQFWGHQTLVLWIFPENILAPIVVSLVTFSHP